MKTRRQYGKSYAEVCHALFINGFETEGRRAVEKLADKVFYLKRLLYPLTRLRPVRLLMIGIQELLSRETSGPQ